jgi:small subunit ribosomal protein S16
MAVRIRLSRIGKKHVPFYRIVAVDGRRKRDGAFLENLGTYDALKGSFVHFHEERMNSWIEKGAIPSEAVKKLHSTYRKGAVTSIEASSMPKPAKKAAVKKTAKKDSSSAQ